eukprot:TRINITY_DN7663_c0_g1_i3.p1 TRINITY_DN7663_c0_g1~~TRINITY_DN7663_c0_g1_i3.p1  ORF type:complete len:166 (-),score=31.15 TRINITY_DN7663_c0_g1_i3:386-883(-)
MSEKDQSRVRDVLRRKSLASSLIPIPGSSFYAPLDPQLAQSLPTNELQLENYIRSFIENPVVQEKVLQDKLASNHLTFDHSSTRKKQTKTETKKRKRMSGREAKKLKLFEPSLVDCKYSSVQVLHQLFLEYMSSLIKNVPRSNKTMLATKLMKADLHGAIIKGDC